MKHLLKILFIVVIQALKQAEGQCSGRIWTVEDVNIGSFTISWRYITKSNIIQFVIQGKVLPNIDLTSTYIGLGWSDTSPTMDKMDIALFIPQKQLIEDRFSRNHSVPSMDHQQDLCMTEMNITRQQVRITFERFVKTNDEDHDISFASNVHMMFSMGSYRILNNTEDVELGYHFFRKSFDTSVDLIHCVTFGCLTAHCSSKSCPCLQDITSNVGQCSCFPSSSCILDSATDESKSVESTISAVIKGICQNNSNPCLPNGICIQVSSDQFLCQCKPDYTGVRCQTSLYSPNINIFNTCRCVNGGVCSINGTCICPNRYRGTYCQLENPCYDYCHNNGLCAVTCTNESCGEPYCNCSSGFRGDQCTKIISDACRPNPCTHGSCNKIANDDFECQCDHGYMGSRCDLFDSCSSNPCNEGNCTTLLDCHDKICGYQCLCPNDTTGTNCDITIDLCTSKPCKNDGRCSISSDTYVCDCEYPYEGTNCDSIIDLCASNPCLNNGTCFQNLTANATEFTCECVHPYKGPNCDLIIGRCTPNPCLNNGTCVQNVTTNSTEYMCECVQPYEGPNCDSVINLCPSNPCLNNGICLQNLTTNADEFICKCQSNYMGSQCEYLNGCASSPCQNDGHCVSSVINCSLNVTCPFTCICPTGTTGQYCEQHDTSCVSVPCLNGGTCVKDENAIPYCQCPTNSTGSRCENIETQCTNTMCSNNGFCFIDSTSGQKVARCLCSEGFTGQLCEKPLPRLDGCSGNPCGDGGICVPVSNVSYYCVCSNGLTGQSCSSNPLTSCMDSPCRHLSTCLEMEDSDPPNYKCLCPKYLTGDRCQYTNACQKQLCLNQGTCVPLGPQNNFLCLCQPEYGHFDCSIHMGSECNSSTCLNGGICDDHGPNIHCICPENYAGPRCEWPSVCSSNTCQNGGTCRQIAQTMAECLCQAGFTGPTCHLRDSCTLSPCKNGGGCTTLLADTGTSWSAYRCVCPPGIYGQNCDTAISSCSSMNCPPYKVCSEQPTGPVCVCAGHKVGPLCQYDDPCHLSSSSCQNGGTCISSSTDPPKSICLCPGEFTGSFCEKLKIHDPCASNPCQERGFCALSTSNNTYTCICQENFIGEKCERTNPCGSSPCLNEGICQSNWNRTDTWFTCRCMGTFTGNRCETSLLNPCGGLCMNGSPCNDGLCVCPAQYTGTFCEFDNPCYNSTCLNGGVCSVVTNAASISYTCACPSLYTGPKCEVPLNISRTDSCLSRCMNGGLCLDGVCICTTLYVGPFCELENPCIQQNPCVNGGTCIGNYSNNSTLSTRCECPPGFTGNSCESTLCSATSCNGGICTVTRNRIVCTCTPGRLGDRCQYIDICATNPCLPNERCEQMGNQYQCISCYDKSSYCSMYQLHNEFCNNSYTMVVDGALLPVTQACQRSCGKCIPVQRLKEIPSSMNYNNMTLYDSSSIVSTTVTNIAENFPLEKCVDRRDDCSTQKAYGFCRILNEKYPDDCIKTCHPDCATPN